MGSGTRFSWKLPGPSYMVFVSFSKLLALIVLILVWFERSLHPAQVASAVCKSFFLRYTSKADAVYAIALEWPLDELTLGAPISTSGTQVTMLGYEGEFNWKPATDKGGIIISVPCIPANQLKSKWAWVFTLVNVH